MTGELAMAEYLPATRATRRALAEEAIEQALADGSPDAVRAALPASRIAWWHPAHTPSRRAFADRVAASAREAGDPWTEVDALDYARNDALELGDRPGFDAAGERTRALAAELRTPHHRWRAAVCDFHDAMLRGDHDEAEQHAGRALACWEGHDHPDAVLTYGYQIAAVRMQQGRPDDVIAMARSVAAAEPGLLIVRAALARACAAAGQLDAARQELDLAMADDMAGVPQDSGWLLAITWYAETAALTRHAAAARHLLGQLHRWVDHIACIAGPGLSWGTVGHTVAALQAVLGDRDRSDATAARATVVDERVGFVSPSSGLSAVGEVTGEG